MKRGIPDNEQEQAESKVQKEIQRTYHNQEFHLGYIDQQFYCSSKKANKPILKEKMVLKVERNKTKKQIYDRKRRKFVDEETNHVHFSKDKTRFCNLDNDRQITEIVYKLSKDELIRVRAVVQEVPAPQQQQEIKNFQFSLRLHLILLGKYLNPPVIVDPKNETLEGRMIAGYRKNLSEIHNMLRLSDIKLVQNRQIDLQSRNRRRLRVDLDALDATDTMYADGDGNNNGNTYANSIDYQTQMRKNQLFNMYMDNNIQFQDQEYLRYLSIEIHQIHPDQQQRFAARKQLLIANEKARKLKYDERMTEINNRLRIYTEELKQEHEEKERKRKIEIEKKKKQEEERKKNQKEIFDPFQNLPDWVRRPDEKYREEQGIKNKSQVKQQISEKNKSDNRGQQQQKVDIELEDTPKEFGKDSQLKPYQKEALTWMKMREGCSEISTLTNIFNEQYKVLHPLWMEYEMTNGQKIYFNPYNGQISLEFPQAFKRSYGGILGDEMGLGKTVMALALICSNPRSCAKQYREELLRPFSKKNSQQIKKKTGVPKHLQKKRKSYFMMNDDGDEEEHFYDTSSEAGQEDNNDDDDDDEDNDEALFDDDDEDDDDDGDEEQQINMKKKRKNKKKNEDDGNDNEDNAFQGDNIPDEDKEEEEFDNQISSGEEQEFVPRVKPLKVKKKKDDENKEIDEDELTTAEYMEKMQNKEKEVEVSDSEGDEKKDEEDEEFDEGNVIKNKKRTINNSNNKNNNLSSNIQSQVQKSAVSKALLTQKSQIKKKNPKSAGTLVIVPPTLLAQWQNETVKHLKKDSITFCEFYGSGRHKLDLKQYDIVYTTYQMVCLDYDEPLEKQTQTKKKYDFNGNEIVKEKKPRKNKANRKFLYDVDWHRVILDEGHKIGNKSTLTCQAIMKLKTKFKWVLTGTPIQNKVDSIYPFLQFIKHYPWNSWGEFNDVLVKPQQNNNTKVMPVLQGILKPIMIRRTKKSKNRYGESIIDLPKKHYKEVLLDLLPREQEFYDNEFKRVNSAFKRMQDATKGGISFTGTLQLLTRMRQCCDHYFLLKKIYTPFKDWKSVESQIRSFASDKGTAVRKFDKEVVRTMTNEETGEEINLEGIYDRHVHKNVTLRAKDYIDELVRKIEVNEYETCEICEEELNQMIITKCLHVYCRTCSNTLFDTRGGVCACPMCRCQLQKNDILDLQKNKPFVIDDTSRDQPSAKIQAVVKEVKRIMEDKPDDKIVVFCYFKATQNLLNYWFEKVLKQPVLNLSGDIPQVKRKQVLEDFNLPRNRIFLATLTSANVGLNLVQANHCIITTPWWNPTSELQAEERVHRLGQKKEVYVTKFFIKDSIEMRIKELQDKKKVLMGHALGNNDQPTGQKQGLGIDDFIQLFRGFNEQNQGGENVGELRQI